MVRGFPWARVLFAIAIAGAGVAVWMPVWWCAIDLLILLIAVGSGVFLQGAGLFARPILARDNSDGKLALTFDDGPDPVHTRKVMDALEAGGHRGTFFVIGRRAENHIDLLKELVARGHALGNHSWNHAHTTPFLAPEKLAKELIRAQELLAQAGPAPKWFRPPVGILSPRVVEAARRAELTLVGWSANARDGVAATVEAAAARLVRALRPGAILVMHDAAERGDRAPIAADVLQKILKEMSERGLRSVTLDELLG